MTYSKIFKSYITKTNNVSKFILENRNDIIASCEEQANCFEGKASMQTKYNALIELGYKFTLELNEKGDKWVRKHSVSNEWTAIKWIAENSQLVREADLEGRKIMGLRGLMSACKPKPTVETTLEGETAEGEAQSEGETTEGKKTPRTMHELLKNITDIVEAEGYEMFKFIDFAISEEGRKITEKETAMSK
jgi:hypothetical protein